MRRALRLLPLVACGGLVALTPAAAESPESPRVPLPEAIFTERAFLQRTVELDADVDFGGGGGRELDLSLLGTWTYGERLQVGLEVPYTIVAASDEPDESGFSDIGFSTQVLLCCTRAPGTAYLSARAEVEAPTGDLSSGIGGNGSFAVSLLGYYGVGVVREARDLGVEVQLGYEQELKRSRAEPDEDGFRGPSVREKELLFGVALVQPVLGGRLAPVFEVLGTTTLDAVERADEGTGLEVGVGFWAAPFEDGPLRALHLGAGFRFPVTRHRSDEAGLLGVVKWVFD